MDEQSKKRTLDRLERKRELINMRFDSQRERINKRFDEKQARMNGKMNAKQTEIVEAALELLSDGGLNDLSLRDIAKRLDIKAPALYWYFKSKSELVDYMAEAILNQAFIGAKPRTNDESWQNWLTDHMGKLRQAMLAYPDGGRVVAGAHLYPAKTLAQIFEDSTLSLTSAGVDQKTTLYTVMTAVHYTFGFVIEEQSSPSAEEISLFRESNFLAAYPNFAKMVKEYVNEETLGQQSYTAGLKLIIKGAEAKR